MVRLGRPGQDTHAKYIDIEWDEPREPVRCPVCLGTGLRSIRQPRNQYGGMWAHYTPADSLSMEDILNQMGVSDANPEEEPDE